MAKRDISDFRDSYAEDAVIGAMLADEVAAEEAMEILGPDCFYNGRLKEVFSAAVAVIEAGSNPDIITVTDWLTRHGKLVDAGGIPYVSALVDACPDVANVRHYAGIVAERFAARELFKVAATAARTDNSAEMLEVLQAGIDSVTKQTTGATTKHIASLASKVVETTLERLKNGTPVDGVMTGIEGVDRWIYSMRPGELVILAARPSVGKTALGVSVVANACAAGKSVLFSSLEMTEDQLTKRFLSNVSGISGEAFQTGRFRTEGHPSEVDILKDAALQVSDYKLHIDDSPGMTPVRLRAIARKIDRQCGLDLIVVDYLQLMEGPGKGRYEIVSAISRSLKAIAKDLGVPVLALSQLKRKEGAAEDDRPQLTDLRESGQIEQDADKVIFLVRDRFGSPHIGAAHVDKHRDGPIGSAPLRFNESTGKFYQGAWEDNLQ